METYTSFPYLSDRHCSAIWSYNIQNRGKTARVTCLIVQRDCVKSTFSPSLLKKVHSFLFLFSISIWNGIAFSVHLFSCRWSRPECPALCKLPSSIEVYGTQLYDSKNVRMFGKPLQNIFLHATKSVLFVCFYFSFLFLVCHVFGWNEKKGKNCSRFPTCILALQDDRNVWKTIRHI